MKTLSLKIISLSAIVIIILSFFLITYMTSHNESFKACVSVLKRGLLPISDDRSKRFLGKVQNDTAYCRGGKTATQKQDTPWVDWQNYYAAGDSSSKHPDDNINKLFNLRHINANDRGIDGALMDLEYQRIELIKFNLFDTETFDEYINGRSNIRGPELVQWDEMRLPPNHDDYIDVGGDNKQICSGTLIRHRTLTGICNDLINPLMGSTGMKFARNVQFSQTHPSLGINKLTRNRHASRISLIKPDPNLISRKLFSREQSNTSACKNLPEDNNITSHSDCNYLKSSTLNVLAAFWIQFMTHDWFFHDASQDTQFSSAYFLKKPLETSTNKVTAWWDASQIYGFDDYSSGRVERDTVDRAKLRLHENYLPIFTVCQSYSKSCPVKQQWQGQESVAFPDNWNIGLSFYHNLFAREHNYFVDKFRENQLKTPDDDSGLRDPGTPNKVIRYIDVDDDRLYHITRLVIAAEIAKIHTLEWTTQLLYNEPLHMAMKANWYGLIGEDNHRITHIINKILTSNDTFYNRILSTYADSDSSSSTIHSVLSSGSGIFGLGNTKIKGILWWKHDAWSLDNLEDDVNGGVNHFGSPFNFTEEFVSVYRLHSMIPDILEYRIANKPNDIEHYIPVVSTIRDHATSQMHSRGIKNWALSMGRQRLGLIHLRNQPAFLQNFPLPSDKVASRTMDVVAMDIIRDRQFGIPRYNEFRRQIGLKSLTSFNDFIDKDLENNDPWRKHQEDTVKTIREIYGTHICDESRIISVTQTEHGDQYINDCLGHDDGAEVDNIEDLDSIVGWMAEYTRPHGFAISETQFQIFILNASRRLFSDRFFTSSFRPEFYSTLGYNWVLNDGLISECPYRPVSKSGKADLCLEPELDNGHRVRVSPLKRLLMRNIPELKNELTPVKNVFDPWARKRGEYYSVDWLPRMGAENDPAFQKTSSL